MTPMNEVKRVAIYARVSTKDKGQDVENQLAQLREFCERQGYVIFDEYMDDESGTKGKREREGFNRLFEDASKRKFDLVLVWSVDRFTREGIAKTLFYLQQLDSLGAPLSRWGVFWLVQGVLHRQASLELERPSLINADVRLPGL